MSVEIYVRFAALKLPKPQEWQAEIQAHGFAVELDCNIDPLTLSGFLPARYQGDPAGFEYYYDADGSDEVCVSLRFGSDPAEAASAIIAAACLCQLTNGQLEDTDAGETMQPPDVIAWARSEAVDLQELIAENKRQPNRVPAEATSGGVRPLRPWWRFW